MDELTVPRDFVESVLYMGSMSGDDAAKVEQRAERLLNGEEDRPRFPNEDTCPVCGHSGKAHDPEDGTCDSMGEDFKVCPCGRPEPRARMFLLRRGEDVSGVSGTGDVAVGIEFERGGPVALRWTSEWPTSVVFHDRGMDSIIAIHGHDGRTRVVWL